MRPIDRFALDHSRINFLMDDEYTEEVFFVEETRKVSKTNLFSINSSKWDGLFAPAKPAYITSL